MSCREALGQLRSLEKKFSVRLSLEGGDICVEALEKTGLGYLLEVKVLPVGTKASQTVPLRGVLSFLLSPRSCFKFSKCDYLRMYE